MRIPLLLLLGSALLVSGCQQQLTRDAVAVSPPAPELPFPEPEAGPAELDGDIVYSYLAGELGTQRGDLAVAYGHYLHAAILAHDAYAAERATRIAIFREDIPGALRAAHRWVELAPNDPQARQTAVLLFLRADQPEEALAQAQALLRIADALGEDGFLQVAAVIGKGHAAPQGMSLMRQLAAEHPGDARAFFALAMAEAAIEDWTAAEADLQRAMELRPDWAKPWVLMARVLAAQGRADEARALLQKGVRQYPNETLLRTAYARTLVDTGDFPAALEQFRELHQQSPEDDDVLYALAVLAVQAEQWDEARSAWQALRNLGKRYDEATYYLGLVEEQTGNKAVAAGLYAAVGKGPLRVDAALRLAQLKSEMGAWREAQQVLAEIRVLEPERAVDIYLAETRLVAEHGNQEEVLGVYETALRAYPGNTDLLYGRAIYAAEQGRIDWVERDLKQVLEQEPDNADALNALGFTLADQTDRYQEAFAYIQKAHKLKPDSAAILDSMGWVYYRLGKLELALQYLNRALERMQDPEIAAHLGEVLWVSGERDKARQVWREAQDANPDDRKLRAVMERFD